MIQTDFFYNITASKFIKKLSKISIFLTKFSITASKFIKTLSKISIIPMAFRSPQTLLLRIYNQIFNYCFKVYQNIIKNIDHSYGI